MSIGCTTKKMSFCSRRTVGHTGPNSSSWLYPYVVCTLAWQHAPYIVFKLNLLLGGMHKF